VTVAPDGSPVDLYLRLPPRGEAEIVHRQIADGAEVLELGCGVGRVTHELLRLGHPVVAVDESPEMLEHVRGATTVCSRIEGLELGRRFDCVLMMSNLVNTDEAQRDRFLATCARHVAADGVVLIEQHEPDWRPAEGSSNQLGDVRVALKDVHVEENEVSAVVEYELDGTVWRHRFRAHLLDDRRLADSLAKAGLEFMQTLDDAGRWVAARLYSAA
jgi:SAM-dependent methyltransferase